MRIILGLRIGHQTGTQPAPRWVMSTLQELEVLQGDGGKPGEWSQGFRMTLRAERGKGSRDDYQVLDNRLLKPGARIIATITLGTKPYVLMDCIITWRQLLLDRNGGTVTLQGKDLTELMNLLTRDVGHPGMVDQDIATQILTKNYQKFGITPRVSAPKTSWPANKEQREPRQVATDLEYLRELAHRHSFVFLVKPGATPGKCDAWWGPEEGSYTAMKSLTANAGPGTNIERLQPVENALAATSTFGAIEAGKDGQLMKINIEKSSDKTTLAKESGLTAYPDLQRTRRVSYSGPFAKEAEARAQAMTDRSTKGVLVATGSVDTFRYGDLLQAPGKVEVRGVGKTYDGDYTVRQVTHKISRAEYKQEFELEREGTGSKVTKVRPS